MFHQSIFSAKRDLNEWVSRHLPALADDTSSEEADGMVLALAKLTRLAQIQLSAMDEQWSQDEWERRDRDANSQM